MLYLQLAWLISHNGCRSQGSSSVDVLLSTAGDFQEHIPLTQTYQSQMGSSNSFNKRLISTKHCRVSSVAASNCNSSNNSSSRSIDCSSSGNSIDSDGVHRRVKKILATAHLLATHSLDEAERCKNAVPTNAVACSHISRQLAHHLPTGIIATH